MNKKEPCLNTLIMKLAAADDKVYSLSERLKMIKELIDKHCTTEEEQCPDVVESEKAVSEAIEEGLISAEEAADATASLSLVADNAQFFNFDILDAIASVVESGEFTMAEVRSTLEGFNSLSEAGKTVVGQESFDYIAAHDSDHDDYTSAKAHWDSLSAADQAVVENQMTAITECRPAGSC